LTSLTLSTFQNIGSILHAKKNINTKKPKQQIISKNASNIKIFSRETSTSSRNLYILTDFALFKLKGRACIIKTRNQ
jgi:hypothetical protein